MAEALKEALEAALRKNKLSGIMTGAHNAISALEWQAQDERFMVAVSDREALQKTSTANKATINYLSNGTGKIVSRQVIASLLTLTATVGIEKFWQIRQALRKAKAGERIVKEAQAGEAATAKALSKKGQSGEASPVKSAPVRGAGQAASQARGGTYVLRDPATGRVMRSGRTNDLARRQLEDARDPALRDYEFEVVHRTDVHAEQRGLEQVLHETHNPPLNRVGGIDPRNPRLPEYRDAARRFLDRQQGGQ